MQITEPPVLLLTLLERARIDERAAAPSDEIVSDGLTELMPTSGTGPKRIALLVRDGVHRAQVEGLVKLLELRGHETHVLADRLGSVMCSDGSRLEVDASLRRWPAWSFDSAVRLSGPDAAGARLSSAEALFLRPDADGTTLPLTCLPWPATSRQTH